MDRTHAWALGRVVVASLVIGLAAGAAQAQSSPGQKLNSKVEVDTFIPDPLGTDPDVFETSAQCEARTAGVGDASGVSGSKATALYGDGVDPQGCRYTCQHHAAPHGHEWLGKAPICGGKQDKKSKLTKDCENRGGTVVDWSYCGDAKRCETGTKVLCKMPDAESWEAKAGHDGTVKWFGKAPFCNAKNGENDCKNLGGTVVSKQKCTDGSDGRKNECCTSGQMVACLVPHITE